MEQTLKLSALLLEREMHVYTRMSKEDANYYDKLEKPLLNRHNFTENSYRGIQRRQAKTEEAPGQFII